MANNETRRKKNKILKNVPQYIICINIKCISSHTLWKYDYIIMIVKNPGRNIKLISWHCFHTIYYKWQWLWIEKFFPLTSLSKSIFLIMNKNKEIYHRKWDNDEKNEFFYMKNVPIKCISGGPWIEAGESVFESPKHIQYSFKYMYTPNTKRLVEIDMDQYK